MLESRGAALCWADVLARPVTPLWRTTDWGYVRFHEGRAQPALRPAVPDDLGTAPHGRLVRRPRRVRVLQQRPERGGGPRLGDLRPRGKNNGPDGDPHAGRHGLVPVGGPQGIPYGVQRGGLGEAEAVHTLGVRLRGRRRFALRRRAAAATNVPLRPRVSITPSDSSAR